MLDMLLGICESAKMTAGGAVPTQKLPAYCRFTDGAGAFIQDLV